MTVETNVFGIEFNVNTPFNSVEEFDNLAGKVGACLLEATNHVIAHKHLARVRQAVCKKLEELSGIERNYTTAEDGKSKKYTETEQTYVKRVTAELGGSEEWEDILAQLKTVAENVKFELVVSVARATKEGLAIADALIASGKAEAFADKYGIELPADSDEARTVLAIQAKKVLDEQKRQAQMALMANL